MYDIIGPMSWTISLFILSNTEILCGSDVFPTSLCDTQLIFVSQLCLYQTRVQKWLKQTSINMSVPWTVAQFDFGYLLSLTLDQLLSLTFVHHVPVIDTSTSQLTVVLWQNVVEYMAPW